MLLVYMSRPYPSPAVVLCVMMSDIVMTLSQHYLWMNLYLPLYLLPLMFLLFSTGVHHNESPSPKAEGALAHIAPK